jgi:hypothetical protein
MTGKEIEASGLNGSQHYQNCAEGVPTLLSSFTNVTAVAA